MALSREKIELPSKFHNHDNIRKWLKNQMNRWMRRKPVDEDETSYKQGRKPTKGWEL